MGYNIREASLMGLNYNEDLHKRLNAIDNTLKGFFVIGSIPFLGITLVEAAPVAIGALQTAGAASTTSVGLAGGGSGASVLTLGGSSGTIGAGGLSSGATWTGVAEAAEGAYTLNMAYLAASQATTVTDAAIAKKTKQEESDFASVRLQVQTGKENISSDVQINTVDIGVTKAHGYLSLSMIYSEAIVVDPTLKQNKDLEQL